MVFIKNLGDVQDSLTLDFGLDRSYLVRGGSNEGRQRLIQQRNRHSGNDIIAI